MLRGPWNYVVFGSYEVILRYFVMCSAFFCWWFCLPAEQEIIEYKSAYVSSHSQKESLLAFHYLLMVKNVMQKAEMLRLKKTTIEINAQISLSDCFSRPCCSLIL